MYKETMSNILDNFVNEIESKEGKVSAVLGIILSGDELIKPRPVGIRFKGDHVAMISVLEKLLEDMKNL